MNSTSGSGNFDRIAPHYDRLSRWVFGQALNRAVLHGITQLPPLSHILVLGGGTGQLLPGLLAQCPQARVLYLEASEAMLDLTQRRLRDLPPEWTKRVTCMLGTEKSLAPGQLFDGLLTPFVLDLYQDAALINLIGHLAGHCAPEARWLCTDFIRPGSSQYIQRALIGTMYAFFRATAGIQADRLSDYPALIADSGFDLAQRSYFFHRMVSTALLVKKGKAQSRCVPL